MRNQSKPLIYLASASPRRSELLRQAGIEHRVQPVDIDESVRGDERPRDYVERLARAKAEALWGRLASEAGVTANVVIGSDTTVAVDREILAKPLDQADGLRMLRLLSGRVHEVHTAVALRHAGGCESRISTSQVTFRELSADEMLEYWASGEPVGKAGGYAIQGRAACFISHIVGSHSSIMGLPLFETSELLRVLDEPAGRTLREARG
jgi:septum formation protein